MNSETVMTASASDRPILRRFSLQLSSGKWILTVLAGIAFSAFSMGLVYIMIKQRGDFKSETLVAMFSSLLLVIQGVYKDYFNKNGEDKK